MTYNDITTDMSLVPGLICCIIDIPGEKEFVKNMIDSINNGPIKYSIIAFKDTDGKHTYEITKIVKELKNEYTKNTFMLITPNGSFPIYHGVYNYIMLNNKLYINVGGDELNAAFADITKQNNISAEDDRPSYYKVENE